jgi:Domain of unknown function (DUF4349)
MNRITRPTIVAGTALALVLGVVACGDDTLASRRTADQLQPATLSEGSADRNGSGDKAAAGEATAVASASAAAVAVPDTGSNPALAAAFDRKIIFNASLTLEARDVTSSFNLASRIAANAGGYVEKSSFSGGSSSDATSSRSASLTLRVPADQYQSVLSDLRGLDGVTVKQESAKSTEVTEQYTDLQSRLRNLEETEQQYLALLAQAKTIDDILKMTDRVNAVRDQVEQAQGRLNLLDHLTDLATIDLSITPLVPAKVEAAQDNGPKGVGEAFADAWAGSLEGARYVASAGAVLAVAAAWVVIPLALLVLGVRLLRRRVTPAKGQPTTSN